jgi:hypothetical protein
MMNISRRDFFFGLGKVGLAILLSRDHGALSIPRDEYRRLIVAGRESGLIKSQWNGYKLFAPFYQCPIVWYVDLVNGNDGNSGKSPEMALRSQSAAIARVQERSSNIIFVLPSIKEPIIDIVTDFFDYSQGKSALAHKRVKNGEMYSYLDSGWEWLDGRGDINALF